MQYESDCKHYALIIFNLDYTCLIPANGHWNRDPVTPFEGLKNVKIWTSYTPEVYFDLWGGGEGV